jgi:hypothetical protein
MLENEAMRKALALPPQNASAPMSSLNDLMRCLHTTTPDDWAVTRVNTSFSALDFARVLGVGPWVPSIVWEYANLVNAGPQTCRH